MQTKNLHISHLTNLVSELALASWSQFKENMDMNYAGFVPCIERYTLGQENKKERMDS